MAILNKSAQFSLLTSFSLAILLFVLGIALGEAYYPVLQGIMNSTLIDCSTTSVSYYQAICTSMDMTLPLLLGLILGIGGFVLGAIFT
jgi:hypothetical protein